MSEFQKCETCSFSCPVKMSDGRSFGDTVYTSRCDQQYQMQFDKNFRSSFDYRQFLIENAEKLIKQDRLNTFYAFQK